MIIEIFRYLKKPTLSFPRDLSLKEKVIDLVLCYLFYLLLLLAALMLLYAVDTLVIKNFYNHSILEQVRFRSRNGEMKKRFGDALILIVALIAPFFEEIVFRLPLDLKKIGIGFSAGVLTYALAGRSFFYFNFQEPFSYFRIAGAISIVLLVVFFLPSIWIETIRTKYYGYFFYFFLFSFALLHVANFKPYNEDVFLFYPLFVLPQFVMGALISFLRMKHGFFIGWTLHIVINLGAFL